MGCSTQNVQLQAKGRPLTALPWGYRQAPSSRSRFFAKLPAEIRTRIYRQAFGDRVFHINLHICVADCWRIRGRSRDSANTQIKEIPSNRASCDDRYWWGSACNHSNLGSKSNLCTDIHGAHFIIDQATPSRMTSIGVMGWLLSCRQAYVTPIEDSYAYRLLTSSLYRSYIEAAEILYSNTFHFAGNAPLRDFTQRVPPHSLACMKGLILNPVGIEPDGQHGVGNISNHASSIGELERVASILGSGSFQNLQELDVKIIDLLGQESVFTEDTDKQTRRTLAVFDKLLPRMSLRFRRLQIYLEDVLYEAARKMTEISDKNLLKEGTKCKTPELHGKRGFWRSVLDTHHLSSGYWVAQDNWQRQCMGRVSRASSGSVSQGLRRLVKF